MNSLALACKSLALAGLALGASLAGAQQMVTARVLSSTPAWEAVPVQGCAPGGYAATSGLGAMVGAVIGGVVGNAFGHGDGRALATAAGVLGGAALGNTAEAQQRYAGGCATRYENRVTGYDVSYEIGGRRYQSRMANDPGAWVQVPAPAGNVYGGYEPSEVQSYPVAPQPVAGAYPLPGGYPAPYPEAGNLPPGAVVTAPAYPPPAYQQPYPVAPQVVYAPAPAQPVYVQPAPLYATPVGVTLSVGGVLGGHHHGRGGWGVGLGF
ncbi:MAG: glycine zipper 2TM domain-containing protein [Ottowia sp.]|uniref:glycine zipper 2TM domain-containing protein n=1 Tax=unclassified Ottowia TaxID=2645081 RepID=UPI003C2B3ACD